MPQNMTASELAAFVRLNWSRNYFVRLPWEVALQKAIEEFHIGQHPFMTFYKLLS
jgi:hypothetical protein